MPARHNIIENLKYKIALIITQHFIKAIFLKTLVHQQSSSCDLHKFLSVNSILAAQYS